MYVNRRHMCTDVMGSRREYWVSNGLELEL